MENFLCQLGLIVQTKPPITWKKYMSTLDTLIRVMAGPQAKKYSNTLLSLNVIFDKSVFNS